jgi:hypothetical protein
VRGIFLPKNRADAMAGATGDLGVGGMRLIRRFAPHNDRWMGLPRPLGSQ